MKKSLYIALLTLKCLTASSSAALVTIEYLHSFACSDGLTSNGPEAGSFALGCVSTLGVTTYLDDGDPNTTETFDEGTNTLSRFDSGGSLISSTVVDFSSMFSPSGLDLITDQSGFFDNQFNLNYDFRGGDIALLLKFVSGTLDGGGTINGSPVDDGIAWTAFSPEFQLDNSAPEITPTQLSSLGITAAGQYDFMYYVVDTSRSWEVGGGEELYAATNGLDTFTLTLSSSPIPEPSTAFFVILGGVSSFLFRKR